MNTSKPLSVKLKQRESLIRLLNFNKEVEDDEKWEGDTWKVLIYDNHCSDIIAPLLRINQLRNQGVTLQLLLHRDRQIIQDVPAIYFIAPTEENIQRLSEDCSSRLYEYFHINFSSTLPKQMMQDFAAKVTRTNSVQHIKSVHDQYIDFISMEHKLFSLNIKGSLVACHHQKLTDDEAQDSVLRVAERLFGVLVTLKVIPIIQCSKNGMAEHVARVVDQKLRDYILHGGSDTQSSSFNFQRPVLILMDRSIDLSVMMNHPWTYQAMIQDMLKSQLNRIWFTPSSSSSSDKQLNEVIYELEEDLDEFWEKYRFSQFPQVAEAVHERVSELKKKKESLSTSIGGDIDGDELRKQLADNTQNLREMATSLPQLQEQKKYIDMHLAVATGLLHLINERDLNVYVTFEDGLSKGMSQDKSELLQVIKESKGTLEDKLRLYLIYYLNKENVTAAESEKIESYLSPDTPYLPAITFIKKTKAFSSTITRQKIEPANQQGFMSRLGKFTGTGSRMKDIVSLVQGGVNNMMSTPSNDLRVTKIVNNIMETKITEETENFLYFDPKIQVGSSGEIPRKTTPFKESIVFMVGGGNYVEYQNLQQSVQRSQVPRNIIYGATELLSSQEFLLQAEEIGLSFQ